MSSTYFTEKKGADFTPQTTIPENAVFGVLPQPKEPKSALGEYRVLAPTAGVRVSPICLGAMNLGNQWLALGSNLNTEEVFKFLDLFYDAGGNFIDTANNYQAEQSEILIGEWMKARGNRDSIVLATKYTAMFHFRMDKLDPGVNINFHGNSAKSLHLSVEASLRKLQTDYLDILYVHFWDWSTSIPELMSSLDSLVRQRKVLYLGASDMPAWVVAAANEYAKARNMAQFVIYQGNYSLAERSAEEEIIPMCRNQGMAFAPFAVLGGGKLKSPKALREQGSRRGQASEEEIKLAETLQRIADEIGTTVPGVALAWARQKYQHLIPIVGGHKIEQLKSNLEMLRVKLSKEQIETIDKASPHQHTWPQLMIGGDPRDLGGRGDGMVSHQAGEWTL